MELQYVRFLLTREDGYVELSPEERQRIYEEEKARREAQEKMKAEATAQNTKYGCIGCMGLLAIIIVIGALLPESKTTHESDDSIMAYIMAQNFIKKRLKAPGSADFPSQVWNKEDVHVSKQADGGYRVAAWVDAQNSFGAKLRSKWVCELKPTSAEMWQVTGFCNLLE